jgi:hypothetical protein
VTAAYPDEVQGLRCGFSGDIGLLGLPRHFELEMDALLVGESLDNRVRVPLARIHGSRRGWPHVSSKRQPLMLTGIGRTGTTWMMRLLAEHPELVTSRQFPYEVRPAAYWMHVMKVLSDPGDHQLSTQPDAFEDVMINVGQNPYNHSDFLDAYTEPAVVRDAMGDRFLTELESFCKRTIDLTYDAIARSEGSEEANYFVEKQLPSHVQNLFWEIYDRPKEIILVRDFRDMICSAKSFDAKRNTTTFAPDKTSSDEEWLRNMVARGVIRRVLGAWESRSDSAHLVKYEDLILEPEETLRKALRYVGIDDSATTVAGMIERASEESEETLSHRTSGDPIASIGRWRRDFDDRMKSLSAEILSGSLQSIGYEIDD